MSAGKKVGSVLTTIVILIIIKLFMVSMKSSSNPVTDRLALVSDIKELVQTLNKEKFSVFSSEVMRLDKISSISTEITFIFTVLDRTPEEARIDSSKGYLYHKPAIVNGFCKMPLIKEGAVYVFQFKATDSSLIETLKIDKNDCLVDTNTAETALHQQLQLIAARDNESLPRMENDLIRQEKILADKNQLIFSYTFLGNSSQFKLIMDDMNEIKQESIIELCGIKYMKAMFNRGMVINTLFKTLNNEELFRFSVSGKDCKI